MRWLITAGNTQTPIDQVRCITNIFTGKTGATIAWAAWDAGMQVTLATSHPEALQAVRAESTPTDRFRVLPYRTFDDLANILEVETTQGEYDTIVHCAAVSDYRVAGIFSPETGTSFDSTAATWHTTDRGPAKLVDRQAGKVKSDEPELWMRLVRTPKLIDRIRNPWGFRGVLVKFKLEVGPTEAELRQIAVKSRQQSDADLIVANTLEGASDWAIIGPVLESVDATDAAADADAYPRIERNALASRLYQEVARLHATRYRRG
ncbi:phosphopantothenoylcysteine decarboxylase domain-containing protein [Tuwongella immobilis]|uniref:DNA/pantothenate metabolism flavoprotein C-terminal domain-containing protein n=1 Tax=Tuwongella immobilis TaxID=692036 RepID=A0A6C2YXA2_9BACT|nr:phosphopantothenoylcysteine decarboxylase [Tuwongella immobilis]VIP05519.1 Phosphopantothenate-cysteine ligase OS=Streptococcus anginosus C238 GN=coaB PE=4 SV=1: DFP: DFP [Tuwongella immobilis]VTS08394.1 Phosphopantothenate-cysteine ligase OS=Streptococcus anginosus C238 GN=coaB PE=4 SV=1: DFP: DFP [Tuwongella immobilis]